MDQWRIHIRSANEFELTTGLGKRTVVYRGQGNIVKRRDDNGDWSELSLIETKLEPAVLFSLTLVSGVTDQWYSSMGRPLIDGSGKAAGKNAYRMKLLDSEGDPLYAWISMYGSDGLPDHRLVKVAANRDCRDGGLRFDKWATVNELHLPVQSRLVTGLAESTVYEISLSDSPSEEKEGAK